MAADTLKAQSLTNADASPYVPNTAAQGASGRMTEVDDVCPCTATGIDTLASTYKLCRFPTGAIPKAVTIAADVIQIGRAHV